METKWLAVVVAWRRGETDLQATIDAASASVEPEANIFPIEDKAGEGPARTRHRGILAAAGAEVIIIIDAHMRFDGQVLRTMGEEVRQNGGLLAPFCHHNAECSFGAKHPSGRGYYAGADIVRRARFPDGQQYSLCWKWSPDLTPGPRPCVGGACYVFRRQWYLDVGSPLAALPAWGCDEEALSISAWYSGLQPTIFDGHVAHRWRAAAPWSRGAADIVPLCKSRMSLIHAVVQNDEAAAEELRNWQLGWVKASEWRHCARSRESETWRAALLKQPRGWKEWKQQVMKPDVIEEPMKKKKSEVGSQKSEEAKQKKQQNHLQQNHSPQPEIHDHPLPKGATPRANYGSAEDRRSCPKCGCTESKVNNTRTAGRVVIRHRTCAHCHANRVTREVLNG